MTKDFLKKNWHIIALGVIFLLSLYIRIINVIPDQLVQFDPIFQYRLTYYFSNWGHLPVWDELTYYTGRMVTDAPFMWYITTWISSVTKLFGMSLMTTASYLAGLFGALIVVPAFFLGKELSNKYGGLIAAALIGTAPQILIRTFGGSFDSDQLVLFFLLLTLYLGYYALKKKSIASFCWLAISFTGFMLTWLVFAYSFFILVGFIIIHLILGILLLRKEGSKEKIKTSFNEFKKVILILVSLLVSLFAIGIAVGSDMLRSFSVLLRFAQHAEVAIVNISIAELQPFNIFNLNGWTAAMGKFVTGNQIIDVSLFLLFIGLIVFGFWRSYKKDIRITSFLLTLFIVAIYTTFQGIRFTEFSSALFLVLVAVGFGYLVSWLSKKDHFLKNFSYGLGILLIVIGLTVGMQVGQALGPDSAPNWDQAWNFLRTSTPENSFVGTWWDPGHMIAGLGERRNMADGAHCSAPQCFYTINDRKTDAGTIMATTNEAQSIELINKYKGNSDEQYWIASADLIGKFQWVQYFGTGCDARTNPECPLYIQVPLTKIGDANGLTIGYYSDIIVIYGENPIPFIVQNRNGFLFREVIYYDENGVTVFERSQEDIEALTGSLKLLADQLGIVFTNQVSETTLWIAPGGSYAVIIPQHLRESVFTKMFMLEGSGLEHFRQVFRNEEVKIYEII